MNIFFTENHRQVNACGFLPFIHWDKSNNLPFIVEVLGALKLCEHYQFILETIIVLLYLIEEGKMSSSATPTWLRSNLINISNQIWHLPVCEQLMCKKHVKTDCNKSANSSKYLEITTSIVIPVMSRCRIWCMWVLWGVCWEVAIESVSETWPTKRVKYFLSSQPAPSTSFSAMQM